MKKILILFLSLIMTISIIGCSNKSSDSGVNNETETPYTMFNNSERSIWYLHAYPQKFGKDRWPHNIFVFEDGQVTVYYGQDLSYGEISKMSDEEIIENREENKTGVTQDVYLHFFTDETGNNVKREVLMYKDTDDQEDNYQLGLQFATSEGLNVYDSTFAGFFSDRYGDSLFLTRVDEHFSFALDELGTEGIGID